jgi:NAD(P)-dependent dehydrogenase (short-subunit alcohol dehydrogenase family)
MKTIVITGASSGIGLASVEACLAAGHRVIATARKPADLERLEQLGAAAVALELSDEHSVAAAASHISQLAEGQIDALFNNAGYGLQVAMEDVTWGTLSHQLAANAVGPVMLTNALLPALVHGSRVVFNSSSLGVFVVPFRGPYCMSKFALEAAADAYRLELEPLGISVHIIQPGPIEAQFRANAHQALQNCLQGRSTRLDYGKHVARLQAEKLTEGALPAAAVADLFMAIVDGRKVNPRYLVTRVAKFGAFAKRLLGSGFDNMARRAEPVKEAGG